SSSSTWRPARRGGSPTGRTYEHSIDWAPTGGEIVFVSNRGADPDRVFNYDIFAADTATGTVRRLTDTAADMTATFAAGVPQANGETAAEPLLDVAYVVRAVIYMASLPPEANVQFLTVTTTKMPYIGRG